MDKGSGAVIVSDGKQIDTAPALVLTYLFVVDTYDDNGNLVIRNQIVTFAVGAGGFGGSRNGTKLVPCIQKPSRSPDLSLTQKTSLDQAAIYRLSGKISINTVQNIMCVICR